MYDIRQPFASTGSPKSDLRIKTNNSMPIPEINSTSIEQEPECRLDERAGETSVLVLAIVTDGSANKLGVDNGAPLAVPLQS